MREESAAPAVDAAARGDGGGDSSSGWYYLDPQARIQGPFEGSEMRQWFEAGYFQVNTAVMHARTHADTM